MPAKGVGVRGPMTRDITSGESLGWIVALLWWVCLALLPAPDDPRPAWLATTAPWARGHGTTKHALVPPISRRCGGEASVGTAPFSSSLVLSQRAVTRLSVHSQRVGRCVVCEFDPVRSLPPSLPPIGGQP